MCVSFILSFYFNEFPALENTRRSELNQWKSEEKEK